MTIQNPKPNAIEPKQALNNNGDKVARPSQQTAPGFAQTSKRLQGSAPCHLRMFFKHGGFPKFGVPFFGGPDHKDYKNFGSILGSLTLENYHISLSSNPLVGVTIVWIRFFEENHRYLQRVSVFKGTCPKALLKTSKPHGPAPSFSCPTTSPLRDLELRTLASHNTKAQPGLIAGMAGRPP